MKQVGFNYSAINLFLIIFWVVTLFAELPSGVIADTYGRMRVVGVSSIVRGAGLAILAFDRGNLVVLLLSALLTAVGDSLYSGAPDSWLVAKLGAERLPHVFSVVSAIGAIVTMVTGYVGAGYLAKISLGLPLMAGAILLLVVAPLAFVIQRHDDRQRPVQPAKRKINFASELSNLRQTLFAGLSEVRHSNIILGYLAAFLPITFIVTGPYNQWQLYFPTGGRLINTANVLIGINLMGIVGSFGMQYLLPHKQAGRTVALMILTITNTGTIIFAVLAGKQALAVGFFWLHVLFVAADEGARWTVLQTEIKSAARSTIVSLNNTLEAAVTVVALGLNGLLSDRLGIGSAWVILSAIGAVVSLMAYGVVLRRQIQTNK